MPRIEPSQGSGPQKIEKGAGVGKLDGHVLRPLQGAPRREIFAHNLFVGGPFTHSVSASANGEAAAKVKDYMKG